MSEHWIGRRSLLASGASLLLLPSALYAADSPKVLSAPIAIDSGRVIVAVGIAGQGPFFFVLDTGGLVGLIRDDLAQRLHLAVLGQSRLGVGRASASRAIYDARDLVIGGNIRKPHVALAGMTDFDFGRDVEGSLAAGLLTSQDAELDFEKGEWRSYPDGIDNRTGFNEAASAIRHVGNDRGSAYLFAHASLDDRDFEFVLDTGAPIPIRLSGAAARASGLWSDERPYAPARDGGRVVRASSFAIGGVRFDRPLVWLLPGEGSGLLGPGLIGLPMLRLFTLSTDVRHRTIWIKRNALPPVPARYALSGLWTDRKGDAIVVTAVGRGSPAERAGIQVDDRIVGQSIDQLRASLAGASGSVVSLDVERVGSPNHVQLTLADYL